MFRLFKRNRGRPSVLSPVLNRVNNRIVVIQRKMADWLNRRTGHWSRRQKWAFLLALTGIFGAASIGCIVIGIKSAGHPAVIQSISVPKHIRVIPGKAVQSQSEFTPGEILRLRRLVLYTDSLRQAGSVGYDSILKSNPAFTRQQEELKEILQTYNQK